MNSNVHIVLVAGGSGKRMNNATPKQYISVAGKPLICHTIQRIANALNNVVFTVVIASKDEHLWQACIPMLPAGITVQTVFGGPERFHSVRSGLSKVKQGELVAIHDAVRPFVDAALLHAGAQLAGNAGSAIPVIHVHESLREIDGALSKPVDRNRFRLCQTPQFFKAEIILDAYRQSYRESFTDDASVVQAAGYTIRLFEGNRENIKITTQADLKFAEMLLS